MRRDDVEGVQPAEKLDVGERWTEKGINVFYTSRLSVRRRGVEANGHISA